MAKQRPIDIFLVGKRPSSGNSQEWLDLEEHDVSESDDGSSDKISQVSAKS